jgi:YVTN family beta-propeller protein
MRRSIRALICFAIPVFCLVWLSAVTPARRAPDARQLGAQGAGVTLLPNGWMLAPAGRHIPIGDLPLGMVLSQDGRRLVVTNNGLARPTLTVVDVDRLVVTQRLPLDHAWLGLAWHPDGTRLYSSGAAQNSVVEVQYAKGVLSKPQVIPIAQASERPGPGTNRPAPIDPDKQAFIGGVAVTPDGSRVFAVQVLGLALSAIDANTRAVTRTIPLPAEGYTAVVSPDGSTVYVSVWGAARVLAFDAKTLNLRREIAVGEHPNALVVSRDGSRLFVACANTNAVWSIDTSRGEPVEQISIALYPNAPPGSTPNALALSPDGRTLLVANADNNTVAVVDVSAPTGSRVSGFIPTGWYPTGVAFSADGRAIFVLSGKGLTSAPNPRGPQPGVSSFVQEQYSGAMLQGALSVVPTPSADALDAFTKTVYRITAYRDEFRLAPANAPGASPIPRRVGDPSPIKYVFYVIRENRTYDQILGDLDRGNGDPTLCLFGEEVTPNAHALARQFVTLDAFFVDAEVSYDGHAFSTGAIATDFVEKIWPTNYGGRGARYLSEGGGAQRNAYGNITAPAQGYIWDAVRRAGKTVRSYGEFAVRGFDPEWDKDAGVGEVNASVPGLKGLVNPKYPPYDLSIPDNQRIDIWLEEFRQFERNGQLPALNIIRLGNDHTAGTRPGYPTPRAMIAENDVALGRLVDAISHSRYWKESAIFVLEDDAQNGPDHVDAHRSPAFVISPFAKRGATVSTLYTTSGMLRTMELILGAEPMTQYDSAATPMYDAFQPTPDQAPFTRLEARVPLDEKNDKFSYGAQASMAMNLEEADRAPEYELNVILWRAVRGPNSMMPPPVRAAFLRP